MDKSARIYGPVLPAESSDDDEDVFGPSLPPPNPDTKPKILGPTLPDGFRTGDGDDDDADPVSVSNEEDSDDDIIGPLPEGLVDKNHHNVGPRLIGKDSAAPKREKWMLEPGKAMGKVLPTKSVTKFSQRTGKEKPLTEQERMELKANQEKEKKMAEFIAKYEKSNKRGASLLETHRQEMRKNKHQKTEPTRPPRREFDRDKDLCAPNMDAKLKQTLISEASSKFGTRFSSGKFEKFL